MGPIHMFRAVQCVHLTESAAVLAKPGMLYGILIVGGADASSVIIYDNASAGSGTQLLGAKAGINGTVPVMSHTIPASAGLYAEITGTAPDVYVLFESTGLRT